MHRNSNIKKKLINDLKLLLLLLQLRRTKLQKTRKFTKTMKMSNVYGDPSFLECCGIISQMTRILN